MLAHEVIPSHRRYVPDVEYAIITTKQVSCLDVTFASRYFKLFKVKRSVSFYIL